jgi:hypothetical protein
MGRIPGGPADPPAAGTNVAGSHTTIGTFVPAAGEAAGPPTGASFFFDFAPTAATQPDTSPRALDTLSPMR